MRTKCILLFAMALPVAVSAYGQSGTTAAPVPPAATASRTGQFGMGFAGPSSMLNVVATKGAPYSAEQVSENSQTLFNGTHINRKPQTEKTYRDSEGRVRTERSMFVPPTGSFDGPIIIEIVDPIGGYKYTLDTQNHVAHRVKLTVRTTPNGAPTGYRPERLISSREPGRAMGGR